MRKNIFVLTTTAAMLLGTTALADAFTDAIVEDLQNAGYSFIEIKTGPTQVKAEGVKGSQKIEVIYDRSTGEILKQEIETADPDDIGRVGVQYDDEDDDFLDDDDDDDHDDDHSGSGHDDDDDDDDHSGSSHDDDDDDHEDDNSGHGSDDD